MKRNIKLFCYLLCAFIYFPSAWAFEPTPNLQLYKQQLLQYHDSGAYEQDTKAVAQNAIAYLKQRVRENNASTTPKKLAVVFDIDETVLSNFKFLRGYDFAFPLDSIHKNQVLAEDDVIPATFALYQQARQNNLAIFFITGRSEKMLTATIKNLHRAGFYGWSGLTLRSEDYHPKSAAIYKSAVRKKIFAKGYDIIINIGDQQSDLAGDYADQTFKLPNPFYFIP